MGRREIKFSLNTSNTELAQIRSQEENVKLERMARAPERFYREMVKTHQDNPGRPPDWEALLQRDAQWKKTRYHVYWAYISAAIG